MKANQDEQYQEEKETKEPLKDSSPGYLRGADYYRRRGDSHASRKDFLPSPEEPERHGRANIPLIIWQTISQTTGKPRLAML